MGDLEEILRRASGSMPPEDVEKLRAAIETLGWLQGEIQHKNASLGRLRKLLFGTPKTEKTNAIFGTPTGQKKDEGGEDTAEDPPQAASHDREPAPKAKGHGRNGAEAYAGARRVAVPHQTLHAGDPCPVEDCGGKLYCLPEPRVLVCVRGHVPIEATVYEQEALRCALCGKVFAAGLPDGVDRCKYDATAAGMIGLLKYGTGMPFHRLEVLQRHLSIPLPATTQWEIVQGAAKAIEPAYEELVHQAAQGEVLHNDDTPMRIVAHLAENEDRKKKGERTGTFTSGIVAQVEEHRVTLFFTGRKHAGENLTVVLSEREGQRGPPIQMCDGLERNAPDEKFETLLANCLGHGRRNFVDVVGSFPNECRTVLEALREVYRHDADARKRAMTPGDRLRYHQEQSGPVLARLKDWMDAQIDECRVEPQSTLGDAIRYMQKRWERLTLFLRVPGAPLDNNIAERVLKKAILHRKNALFFKSENGARVGDIFMSLIHTAELNGVNPFDYLTELLRHPREVRENADAWMPWNYRDAVTVLA